MFERFWKLYPRGEAKGDARAEWDKLRPDRELMWKMSEALNRQKESADWKKGIGIPYACRWIKKRRWEDEVVPGPERLEGGARIGTEPDSGWAETGEVF